MSEKQQGEKFIALLKDKTRAEIELVHSIRLKIKLPNWQRTEGLKRVFRSLIFLAHNLATEGE